MTVDPSQIDNIQAKLLQGVLYAVEEYAEATSTSKYEDYNKYKKTYDLLSELPIFQDLYSKIHTYDKEPHHNNIAHDKNAHDNSAQDAHNEQTNSKYLQLHTTITEIQTQINNLSDIINKFDHNVGNNNINLDIQDANSNNAEFTQSDATFNDYRDKLLNMECTDDIDNIDDIDDDMMMMMMMMMMMILIMMMMILIMMTLTTPLLY